MHAKMKEHAKRDNQTGQVWHNPSWISYNLKDGSFVVWKESRLIESFAIITKRVIHGDECFPVFVKAFVEEFDFAREVFWGIGAQVAFVFEFDEFHRKRLVRSFKPKCHLCFGSIFRSNRLRWF